MISLFNIGKKVSRKRLIQKKKKKKRLRNTSQLKTRRKGVWFISRYQLFPNTCHTSIDISCAAWNPGFYYNFTQLCNYYDILTFLLNPQSGFTVTCVPIARPDQAKSVGNEVAVSPPLSYNLFATTIEFFVAPLTSSISESENRSWNP